MKSPEIFKQSIEKIEELYLKELLHKITSLEGGFLSFFRQIINYSWFTVKARCGDSIS